MYKKQTHVMMSQPRMLSSVKSFVSNVSSVQSGNTLCRLRSV